MSPSDISVFIDTKDGCAELYLQNHNYVLLASGVGHLSARVPAGLYKVRQRIGDNERSQVLDVPAGDEPVHLTLPGLAFASPIPLEGTNTSREFQMAALDARGLTAPATGEGQLSVLLRDSRWKYGGVNATRASFLAREGSRLRIESFDGSFSKSLDELGQQESDAGFVRVNVELPPGAYVLAQRLNDQSQQRLPLLILHNWALHVFLQIPPRPDGSEPVGLDLDHAALVYATPGKYLSPGDPGLLLLETARKAFARRRAGVADGIVDRVLNGKFGNPILGLLGAYLLLGEPKVDADRTRMVVDNTASLLGEGFPDIIALRSRLTALKLAPPPKQHFPLTSPPLLAVSWAALTQATTDVRGIADDISELFWFPFTVESTSTWFVWTEMPNTRVPASPRTRSTHETRSSSDTAIAHRDIEFETVDFEMPPSVESVRDLLGQLLSSDELQPWVRHLKGEERASGSAPPGLGQLDRILLAALSSAQSSFIPGVIDAQSALNTIVGGLNVPMSTAQNSAENLLHQLMQWNAGRSGESEFLTTSSR